MYMMNSMHSMMLGTQQDKHNMNFIQEAMFSASCMKKRGTAHDNG